jgi:Mn-dependent DtxR family transcriptional regulator
MTHDRAAADTFELTQEFLAAMLGVRRASVSAVGGAFQKAGLIRYSRGKIIILDRAGLEAASCECYDIIRRVFAQLLPYPQIKR